MSEGWKNQNPEEENVICGPDGQNISICVSVPILEQEQVSVALLRGGDIIKSGEEGGSCVIAQTGSMSNILKKTDTMKMSVAELCGKFNDVKKNECVKCARLSSVRCADCLKNEKCGDKNIVDIGEMRTRRVRWTKPTFKTQTEGGRVVKLNVKGSTEGKVQVQTEGQEDILSSSFSVPITTSKFESKMINTDIHSSIPSKQNMKSSNNSKISTYNVGKEGRGLNSALNITPVKRKLISNKQVSKLVPIFDNTRVLSVALPSESRIDESPAKRRKVQLRKEGQHTLSQE